MKYTIKINKAIRKSHLGNFNRSANAMLEYVPEKVFDQLNSDGLADLLDALWKACQDAKIIKEKEICDEGCVWDWRQKKLRDIA